MPGRGKAAKTPISGANAIVRLDAVCISGKIEHIEIQRAASPRKGPGMGVGRSTERDDGESNLSVGYRFFTGTSEEKRP
jgi:hypothetical protein